MTDKEKKELKDGVISIFKRFNILDHTATIGSLRDDILRYINSLQEEPVSKVWHNTNEIPNYNEDDMYSNQILVFGKSSVGQGCSVCSMIDKETIYAPISHKEYNWGECPFTMWAYISDVLRVQEEPVSPCENCEGDGLAGTCASISELGRCPLKYRKEEELVSEDLGEEIGKYCSNPENFITYIDVGFKQSPIEKDDIPLIIKAIKFGAKWQKEQMMKDAISAKVTEIYYPTDSCLEIEATLPEGRFKDGDKVLIIKED